MLSLAICIATHERPHWLVRSLDSIVQQSLLPDEVIVSDSSATDETYQLFTAFKNKYPYLTIKYFRSERKALPWQRWLAFSNSKSDLIFFVDDDICLAPSACSRLVQAFISNDQAQPAGIGLMLTMDDDTPYIRLATSWRERWLGTSEYPSGTITPGGLTVSHAGLPQNSMCFVQWLWGASMAFPRETLEKIGMLHGLFRIYEIGIGKAEDAVLSVQASHYGKLILLTDALAFHPPLNKAERTANSHSGWLLGLRETVGRAHTMKWMAVDRHQAKKDWAWLVSRELLISSWRVAKYPLKKQLWGQWLAVVYGVVWCLKNWKNIPETPQESLHPKRFFVPIK